MFPTYFKTHVSVHSIRQTFPAHNTLQSERPKPVRQSFSLVSHVRGYIKLLSLVYLITPCPFILSFQETVPAEPFPSSSSVVFSAQQDINQSTPKNFAVETLRYSFGRRCPQSYYSLTKAHPRLWHTNRLKKYHFPSTLSRHFKL